MKRKLLSVLLLVSILTIVPVISVQAKKPLIGTMDLQFNLGWPGPNEEIPDWVGHITIDSVEYGMVFFNVGTGKSPNHNPGGQVAFFDEIWAIYESIDLTFDEDGVLTGWDHGPVVLLGTDEGVVSVKNDKYRMNGIVTETNEGFSEWLGRNVHMSGYIIWYPFGAPQYAPGIFRIN